MTTFDLIRGTRRSPERRRRLALRATPLVAGAVVLTVATAGGGAGGSGGRPGPTMVAEARDLATTLEDWGTLQRSGEHTVAYAGALDTGEGTGTPSGAGDTPTMEPVSYVPSSTSTSTSSTSTSTSTTSEPCRPTSTTSTSTSSTSTTSTTACPPTSTTVPTTTPTTSPTDSPGPGGGDAGPSPSPSPDGSDHGDAGDAGEPLSEGPRSGGPGGSGPGATVLPGDDGGDGGDHPSATLTSVMDVGSTADRGTVLYTADQEPVVALAGDLPAWRTLEPGADDGADVRQLEENLTALGYGSGLDVDTSFTAETAAAVEAWERDLGRSDPDGVVTIGDVVFLTAPGDVLGHDASVGDTLEPGSPVLTIGSEQRVVEAEVAVTEAGGWTPGATVELEWADTSVTTGTVFGTGRDVVDGKVTLLIAVPTGDAGAGSRRSGAEATITLEDARRDGVIAVPVGAIVDDGGAPAVRVVQGSGPDRVIPVETGLVADGWVEITAGLDAGEEVRLPG